MNNDPYYYSVFISSISSIYDAKVAPRLYINDSNNDEYPDIITADSKDNSIGLLFNPGKTFWEDVQLFYRSNNYNTEKIYNKRAWFYIPLYNIYKYNLHDVPLIDFAVIKNYHPAHKRINFEIFTIYENGLYWFIENNLNVTSSMIADSKQEPKNFIYCMLKSDVIVDKFKDVERDSTYKLIIDLDINYDTQPEFILYYENTLYLIKKYTPYLSGFGWNSAFWIYICIYIYIVCSVIGLYEFFKLNNLNNKISQEKLLRQESFRNAKDEEMRERNKEEKIGV